MMFVLGRKNKDNISWYSKNLLYVSDPQNDLGIDLFNLTNTYMASSRLGLPDSMVVSQTVWNTITKTLSPISIQNTKLEEGIYFGGGGHGKNFYVVDDALLENKYEVCLFLIHPSMRNNPGIRFCKCFEDNSYSIQTLGRFPEAQYLTYELDNLKIDNV